ncbi:MAG: helix-turn-helix transcriptional regulator [Burkholderiales bacterium]|nr:helix-turn-helix transcriptional regulator [Burkholderiales bacterium]
MIADTEKSERTEGEKPRTTRDEAAWLTQIELLANLPYAATALIPAVVAAIRDGIDADFGAFGWVEGEHLRPVAFWSERMTEPVFRSFTSHLDVFFDEFPLRIQLDSDGEAIRGFQDIPDYESHWHLTEIIAPLGARWATGVPVRNQRGECSGFLYLYRRADAGRFTDDEQATLRRARDRLTGLHTAADQARTVPLCLAATATLQFDALGTMVARGARAIELLYLCQDVRLGVLDWAQQNVRALPGAPRALIEQQLVNDGTSRLAHCSLEVAAGRFDFRIERLERLDTTAPQITVTIQHWQPADIAVAKQLAGWPLSAQEKRLIVATAREMDHKEIADALGVTVGTLKAYVNRLNAKLGVESRKAFVQQLLTRAAAAH